MRKVFTLQSIFSQAVERSPMVVGMMQLRLSSLCLLLYYLQVYVNHPKCLSLANVITPSILVNRMVKNVRRKKGEYARGVKNNNLRVMQRGSIQGSSFHSLSIARNFTG
jgi:hypothetical protein